MKFLSIAVATSFAGCATSNGVVPMADGTYTVTAQANFGPNKAIEGRRVALDEATRTCAAQGKELGVIALDDSGDIGRSAGPLALHGETRLLFRCIVRQPPWPGSPEPPR